MRAAGDESDSDDDDFAYYGDARESQSVWDMQEPPKCKKEPTNIPLCLNNKNSPQKKEKKTIDAYQAYEGFRIAAMNGNLKSVEEFLRLGINVNEPLKAGGWTALMYACSGSFHRLVQFLLLHGADPNCHKDGYSALMAACASPKDTVDVTTCVKYLLNRNAEVNMCEKHKMTPIMFAAKGGRSKVVRLLLEHGAEVDAADSRGWTALCWAANHGHGEVVKILIESNANPKHLGICGESVVQLASENGYAKIAEILSKVTETNKADSSVLNQLPKTEIPRTAKATTQNIEKYGELELFLAGLQLLDLLPVFQQHKIDFQTFLSLTEDELVKIGLDRLGTRRLILDAIRDVHKKDWTNASIPMIRNRKHISCPEAYAIIGNITKHFNFIQSTAVYIHKQSKINPQDLEMGKSDVSIGMLIDQTTKSVVALTSLHAELLNFNEHLMKLEHRVEHQPVGVICGQRQRKSRFKMFPVTFCLLAVCLAGLFYYKPDSLKALRIPAFIYQLPIYIKLQNLISNMKVHV